MSHRFSTVSMLLNNVLLLSDSVNPTAEAGIAAPIGSKYWRSGTAGDYTKTGAGDAAWTAIPTTYDFNLADYGAAGDGVTNDDAAFRAAVTDTAVIGGALYVPPGTYVLTEQIWNGLSNIRVIGTGWGGSTLKLVANAAGGRKNLFRLVSACRDIEFEGITFDQSGLTNRGADVCHLFDIAEARTVKLINCRFTGGIAGAGAYVHVGGDATLVAERVFIDGCRMDAAGGPCVWFDTNADVCWLTDSTLINATDDDCVVFDDTASSNITNIKVMNNHIEGTQKWAVRGTSSVGMTNIQIACNYINGLVKFTELKRSQIQQNEIYFSTAVHTDAVCTFTNAQTGELQFQNNIIGRESTCAVGLLVKWNLCAGVQQHGNHWIQEKAGSGLWHAFDTTEFQSVNNVPIVTDAGSSTVNAYIVESSAVNITGIQVKDQLSATAGTWLRGVHVKAGATTISNIQVDGILRNVATGVELEGLAARFTGFFQSRGIFSASVAAITMPSGVYCRIAGNASTFGANGITGAGSPEGAVTARPGSFYFDTTNGKYYVKETLNTAFGWIVK